MKTLVLLCLFTASMHEALAQNDSFDIIKYKAPDGWTKNEANGVLTFSVTNEQTGGFCIIATYAAATSSGDAAKDFDGEWNRLVASTFQTNGSPKTQTKTTGGWKIVTGAQQVKKDSFSLFAVLTVYSGHGKMLSVVTNLNDKSYAATVDVFLASIRENKNAMAKTSPAGNTSNTQATQSMQPGGEGVVGTWSTRGAILQSYVSPSGAFLGDASSYQSEDYIFKTDGTFKYRYLGTLNRRLYYSEWEGVYTINGDQLTIIPKKRKGGFPPNLVDESQFIKSKTYKWFVGPYKDVTTLHLHNDNDYYLQSSFPWNTFKLVLQQ